MSASQPLNTHGYRMRNGKHGPKDGEPGDLITRVPTQYLRWMINAGHEDRAYARAELDRRGSTLPDIEVSAHAIDRASLRCRKIWHETATSSEEGLHAWLMRVAREALDKGETLPDPHNPTGARGLLKAYIGMKFAFLQGEEFPVLKTVMPLVRGKMKNADGIQNIELDPPSTWNVPPHG